MVSPCSSGEYGGEARGSEERSYPLLIDMLSNKCAAPFDLKSFLRFAKRHVSHTRITVKSGNLEGVSFNFCGSAT